MYHLPTDTYHQMVKTTKIHRGTLMNEATFNIKVGNHMSGINVVRWQDTNQTQAVHENHLHHQRKMTIMVTTQRTQVSIHQDMYEAKEPIMITLKDHIGPIML